VARSSKMSVQKRMRERKKAEQAELKRANATRRRGDTEEARGGNVADRADLDSYGMRSANSDPRDDR